MNRILVSLFLGSMMLSVGTEAMALPKEVTTKKDIMLPDGKTAERIIRNGNSLTSLVPCRIKAGKHFTNGFILTSDIASDGIFITYEQRNPNDRGECSSGIHFIPRVPIEVD